MFAPIVAKPKSTALKPAEAIDLARRSRWSAGDQATCRFVAPQTSRIPDASGAQTTDSTAGQETALSWDFSKIPVHPPGSAERPQTPRFFARARFPIQAKLKVGAIDDPLEYEADRVADHVMRMPTPASGPSSAPPQVSRKCAACEEDKLQKKEAASSLLALTEAPPGVFEQEADRVADAVMRMSTPPAADGGPVIRSTGPRIQPKCAACGAGGDEPCTCVQRKAESSEPAPLAAISDRAPTVLHTGGQPLSSRDRRFFEPRFGADFSRVRIHSDTTAAEMAQALHARAFTVGGHIVFGAGLFTPETQNGRRLLAHELTHVVQQEHRPHAVQRQAEPATEPRIVVTPTKEGVNITITADTKLEGSEVFVLTVMYGKRVSRERATELIKIGEDVGCAAPVCKTGMQPGETIDLFFGPDQRSQQEHVQAPKRKLPAEVQNALESGYMRIFMLDRQTQKHIELPPQPDFSEDRAVIMARNALLVFSHDDIGCFWRWLAGERIEGWWNLAYRLDQFLAVRPNVCAPVDRTPLERLLGHEDIYALVKETEKLEQQAYTQAGRYDQELPGKIDAARAARDEALRDADFPDVGAFDTAANEFRVYFRTIAVAVLEHSLDQTEHVLRDAVGRYQVGSNPNIKPGSQINPVAQQLYDELYRLPNSQARSPDQLLIDHPILQGVTVWDTISRAENVLDFSNRLTRYALERLNIDLPMVRNALGRSQDVVFKFGPIVDATKERVGVAQESIFASVIEDQRGKPGEPWWQKALDVGLLLLSFVPGPIGFAARTVSAIRDIGGAGTEYSEQYSAYEVGYQDKPSVAPIAISVGANVVPGVAVAGAGKVYRTVKALRAASSLETAAARTAATSIVKTEAGDVVRTEGDVLATDLARTEDGAAKDIAKAEGEAVNDVGKTDGAAAEDVAKTEGEAAKDIAKTKGETVTDVGTTEGEAAKDVAETEDEAAKDVAKEEGEAAKDVAKTEAPSPPPPPPPPPLSAAEQRVLDQEGVVASKAGALKRAEEGVAEASQRVSETKAAVQAAEDAVANAEREAAAARKLAQEKQALADVAPKGATRAPKKATTAAKNAAEKADAAVGRAKTAVKRARKELTDAQDALTRRAKRIDPLKKELQVSKDYLERMKAAKSTEAPRLRRGEKFDPAKRRPNLSEFDDLPYNDAERVVDLRKQPRARVAIYKAEVAKKFRAEHDALILRLKNGESPQAIGHEYEQLIKKDLTRDTGVQRWTSTVGDKTRVRDYGVHEFTIETDLGDAKLDQLWRDLQTPYPGAKEAASEIMLTVPSLSKEGEVRLAKMAAIYEHLTGHRPRIKVRETML